MPGTKSSSGPKLEKTYASIIKDPDNQLLTITIPLVFEVSDSDGSDSVKSGPMDTLVDFIQTFCLAPEKKPEQEASEDFRIPCPYYSQCRSIEEPEEIKAEVETASPETESFTLTPEQELKLKCFTELLSAKSGLRAEHLINEAEKVVSWILTGEAKS